MAALPYFLGIYWINSMETEEEQMGQSIQEWTKKNLWKTVFKKFEGTWSA